MSHYTNRQQTILFLFVLLIFMFSVAVLLKILFRPWYFDFQWYYYGIQTFVHGGNPYSLPNFPFPYPPPALLFFLPFSIFSLYVAGKLFVVFSFVCLFVSVILLLRLFKTSPRSQLGLFLIALVCNFFPVKFTLVSGQINAVILLLVVLFVYWFKTKRLYLAGIVLTCAIAFKLFPILILPYLFLDKQWKTLVAIVLTSLFLVLIVLLAVPFQDISVYFSKVLTAMFHAGGGTGYYDQSLAAFVARSLHNPISVLIYRVITVVLLGITAFVFWRVRHENTTMLLRIGIILILNVILNSFTWQHHLIWLLITLFVTFFYIRNQHLSNWHFVLVGVSYLLMATNLKTPSAVPVLIQSHEFYGALLLYILDIYLLVTHTSWLRPQTAVSKSKTNL